MAELNEETVIYGLKELIEKAPAGGLFHDAIPSEVGRDNKTFYFLVIIQDIPYYVTVKAL